MHMLQLMLIPIDAATCYGIADGKADAKAPAVMQRNSVEKLIIMWGSVYWSPLAIANNAA